VGSGWSGAGRAQTKRGRRVGEWKKVVDDREVREEGGWEVAVAPGRWFDGEGGVGVVGAVSCVHYSINHCVSGNFYLRADKPLRVEDLSARR